MAEKDYVYIGNGEIKYLDKNETKLGAFFKIDIDKLLDELNTLKSHNQDLKEVMIYALPNKLNSYSVKLKTKCNGKKNNPKYIDLRPMW